MHWLPLRLARTLAMRPLVSDPSRDQPAMRTIVLGLAFVLGWYLLLALLIAHWRGSVAAGLALVVVFVAARVDFIVRDRMDRAWRRARTYLALRANPGLRDAALAEIDALIIDGLALEASLLALPIDGR
jgi:hypothetical protein